MKRYFDIISGIVISVFSLVMLYETKNIMTLGIMDFGPKFIPRLLCIALLVMGIIITVTGFINARKEGSTSGIGVKGTVNYRRVGLTVGLVTFYIGTLQVIGFIITTVIYLFFQFLILGERKRKNIVIYAALAAGFTVGIYYLFYAVFNVLLPPGLLY